MMNGDDNGYIANKEKEKQRQKNVKEYQDKFFKKINKRGNGRNGLRKFN